MCINGEALRAIVNGGTPQYTYNWSSGETTDFICTNPLFPLYSVTVIDANGCSTLATYNIQNTGTCSFTYTQTNPLNPYEVYIVATYDSTLNSASIYWDMGDGNTVSGSPLRYTYTNCGNYNVTLLLVDSNSTILCSYGSSVNVSCGNQYCQAYFFSSQNSANPLAFSFTDNSVYNPVSFQWNFGDGITSTLQNPSHTYATAGNYNVCLIITDSSGCSSTYCKQINANVPVQDMEAYLYHITTVTPGFPLWVFLGYYNAGTSIMNGTVQYRYPAGTTFNSSSPAPISHSIAQRLLTYDYSNVYPNSSNFIMVDLDVSPSFPLGAFAFDTMWVYPINGDLTPPNNVSSIKDICVGSWDPNDKAVSPKGLGEDGNIPVNTEDISYVIRFQNTGSALAQNIEIRDAISNNIDLTSIIVSNASHAHITEIIGNELVVTFNDIMLPDSNSNEPASHGHIVVKAKLKPGLTEGMQIFNTAEIYFDFNPAVITNTVVNTLKDETSGIGNLKAMQFSLIPNPAENEMAIVGRFQKHSSFEIVNELGQVMQAGVLNSEKTVVDVTALHAGIYFVKVKNKNETSVQRLLISK